jgi:hypothetical protein
MERVSWRGDSEWRGDREIVGGSHRREPVEGGGVGEGATEMMDLTADELKNSRRGGAVQARGVRNEGR